MKGDGFYLVNSISLFSSLIQKWQNPKPLFVATIWLMSICQFLAFDPFHLYEMFAKVGLFLFCNNFSSWFAKRYIEKIEFDCFNLNFWLKIFNTNFQLLILYNPIVDELT